MTVMSGSGASEGAALLERIRSGQLPREAVLLAARAFLPLPQEDLILVLMHLIGSEDPEIASSARSSLGEIPPRLVLAYARDPGRTAEELDTLSRVSADPAVLETLVRNRATSDETVERLAAAASPHLQDVIAVNQERLLRRPSILDALLANPELTADVRRRVGEVREEFFEKRRNVAPAAAPVEELEDDGEPLSPEQEEELARLVEQAASAEASAAPPPEKPVGLDEAGESVWTMLGKLTVAQKVQRAFKGSMTERSILIRERNKLIAGAVARSPRLTDQEVESFAALRNVEEEVLRIIGMSRTWMAKYNIMLALVRNPKAPIGVVLPLINRLNIKDLKSLSGDRNVSETVRSSARRLYNQRKT